jgi:hypothetical protein
MTDMPSTDQIQTALAAVNAAIAAAKVAWADLMPILAWLGVMAHVMAQVPKQFHANPIGTIFDLLAGNYKNAANK